MRWKELCTQWISTQKLSLHDRIQYRRTFHDLRHICQLEKIKKKCITKTQLDAIAIALLRLNIHYSVWKHVWKRNFLDRFLQRLSAITIHKLSFCVLPFKIAHRPAAKCMQHSKPSPVSQINPLRFVRRESSSWNIFPNVQRSFGCFSSLLQRLGKLLLGIAVAKEIS